MPLLSSPISPRGKPMRFQTTDELSRELIRLRLASADQLSLAHARFDVSSDPETLLKALEGLHALTTYQAAKLRSDEKTAIVLGNNKLMYQNASGSFARVFRACRIDNNEIIGVKVLRAVHASNPVSVAQFHREAELCSKLKHPNIVPIYDVGYDDGFHYFTMEFIEGGNLRDFIKIRGKLGAAEVLRYGIDMAAGLEYALSQGMSHRDFKMSNVLMSSNGIAKLVDFGLAGEESSSGDGAAHAVEYATLEKGSGAPRNDPRSDIFFLGTVLYELVSGIPAYPSTSVFEERKRFTRYSGIRAIRTVSPDVSKKLCDIIDRMLQVNPSMRYQSCTEALKDLRSAMQDFGGDPRQQSAAKKTATISTVLCVEHRIQQQDKLRDYLSKHGYRVLMLSSWDRALARIKSNPPDCVLVLGDSLSGDAAEVYDEATNWCKLKNVACVLVLPPRDKAVADQLLLTKSIQVLSHPVSLREIRGSIGDALEAIGQRT